MSGNATTQELSKFRGIIPNRCVGKSFNMWPNTMCQMFCGWRIHTSKRDLVMVGSGVLKIDAITGQCAFDVKIINKLKIAGEIRVWMQQELMTNKIPISALTDAHLTAELSFSVVPWSEPTREIFYSGGKAICMEKMNRCLMECESNVMTDEAIYHSKLTEIQEWPVGWPIDTER